MPEPTDITTELDGVIPEMPSQCATCQGWFELNDMWGSLYNFSGVVCDACHRDELAPAADDEEPR